MIIIGFVVSVMIFSSFAIVFSNSGNNLNNSNKQILNLPEKSLTSTVVNKYQIDLSNLPSGNGYYQQLITLNNYDTYGINSNGSNIEFFSSNNTQLYAWIQSINSSAIQVWVKNYNGSSTINMKVLPYFENLFSANGYIGISSLDSENNYKLVFANLSALSSYSMYTPFVSISYMYYQNGSGENDLVYNANSTNNNNLSIHASLRPSGSNDYFILGVLNSASGPSYPASPSHSFKDIAGYYYVEMNAYTSTKYGMEVNGTGLVNVSFSFTPTEGQEMSLQNSNGYIYGTLHPQTMPTYTINQILNLQSGISKTVTISNANNNVNEPIEFYDNFLLYVNTNNNLEIENLSSGLTYITNLTYNNEYAVNYYGMIISGNILYVYLLSDTGSSYDTPEVYIYGYTVNNLEFVKDGAYSFPLYSSAINPDSTNNLGISANSNGIYTFISVCNYDNANYINYPCFKEFNFNDNVVNSKVFTNITLTYDTNYSVYTMGNFLTFTENSQIYTFNYNTFNIYKLSGNENYGEMIYNNTYENQFNTLTTTSLNNTYISDYIDYGCVYNPLKRTDLAEPQFYNSRECIDNGGANHLKAQTSFISANYYTNAYVNFTGYLLYNQTYSEKLNSYTMPYTILNKTLYYEINSYTYAQVELYTYKLNITSYNHNSYQLKDYFYYNDNIYSGLQFNFTNDNGIFSILPLNYSVYVYNGSYITTSSSEFKSIGNGIYQYNLSIYYGQLTTNTTSSIKPLDISSYIYPIGIIIFVSFLGAMVYFSKSEGKK